MSAALPDGTATFLFSDIESSSALWEREPDAMRGALADHDAIVRDAVSRHRGIVFKTIGDAFCCVFARPQEAVDAAVDAQRALRAHAWPPETGELRVRMGVHCGQAVERDGDYFGPTINRVARLMAIGSGGQILVSSAAAASLLAIDSAGAHLRDLGTHRLRDLSQPEAVFQVVAEGLPTNFPALTSLDARPNNLPSQFSTFVGRRRETDALRGFLEQHRLVTIAGPGGIGKTRLALHLAAAAIDTFEDGAWFVDLSAISDPGFVTQTIASELGVREARSETIAESLLAHLVRKRLLLILDNSEHVLSGVAAIVKTILSHCASVTVLITSREPLHLVGEQVYRLSGLPDVPPDARADDLLRHDTTRLFLERARAVAPALIVGDEAAHDVAEICRKLDGIPLAIELAAARVSALSIHELDERLSEKLPLLTSRDTTQERHRTLRATIDWSYRLLDAPEKEAFAKLSVFAGGFALEAYERVAAAAGALPLDQLESLVEKSFVQALDASASRYRCLDVMREYGARELIESGASAQVAEMHARYYGEFVAHRREARGAAAAQWYRVLDEEIGNLRAALDWCATNDSSAAARLTLDLAPFWRVRSTITEARARIDAVRNAPGLSPVDRAELLNLSASFATMQDDFERSLRDSHEALGIYRAAQDAGGTGEAIFRVAEVEHRKGHLEEAQRLYSQALELFVTSGHARGEMLCLANLGMIARQRGEHDEAKRLLEEALSRADAAGEHRIAGELEMAIGWVNLQLGDRERALALFEDAYAQKSADGDRYGACAARHGLATVALVDGRLPEAFEGFRETVGDALELRLHDYAFRGFDGIAAVFALRGDAPRAARYLGLAQRIFRDSGRELRDSMAYDTALAAIGSAIDADRRAALFAEGASLSPDAALSELR